MTQKYLEHLISQKKFNETAAACAKLLKVPFIINRRNTTCHRHFSHAARSSGCSAHCHFRRGLARGHSSAHGPCWELLGSADH